MSKRNLRKDRLAFKGAWHFSAEWTFSGHTAATTSTDPDRLKYELQQIKTKIKHLVLGAQRFPLLLRNIHLVYTAHNNLSEAAKNYTVSAFTAFLKKTC